EVSMTNVRTPAAGRSKSGSTRGAGLAVRLETFDRPVETATLREAVLRDAVLREDPVRGEGAGGEGGVGAGGLRGTGTGVLRWGSRGPGLRAVREGPEPHRER